MKNDNVDGRMTQLLETAAPEMSAGWEARATDRLTAIRPARGISRRLVIAAIGVAALVGLGFVPIPMGKAPGALQRAMAAAEQATTVHAITKSWSEYRDEKYEYVREEWLSDEGFWRQEGWENGKPCSTHLAVGPWDVEHYTGQNGKRIAYEDYNPCDLHPADMPGREVLEKKLEWMRYLAARRSQPEPAIDLREHRETSLWGGTVDVVDAELTIQKAWPSFFAGPYDEGARVLATAEIDPTTNRLLSVREYKLEGSRWQQTYEATYEWDVEIPEDLKQVELPRGTTLTRRTWWANRAEQVLAQEDTRDWTVTLHAIDIKRNGDVVLSLSRVETPDSQMPSVYNSGRPLVVEAVGSVGEQYTQDNGFSCFNARHSGYWTTTLMPTNRNSHPRSITLTIHPYPASPSEDQSVTFRNIPLPPRQNTDDLFAAETEVIQY